MLGGASQTRGGETRYGYGTSEAKKEISTSYPSTNQKEIYHSHLVVF
jgi:hypothetical protein